MSVYTYYNWTADQYRPLKLQLQLILLLYFVSHRLEICINVRLYLLQLNSWPVPTSKLQLQLILLLNCVFHRLEMYRNVSLYLLQLNSWPVPTSKTTVTANTLLYSVSHQLEMYINLSLYLLQLNSRPVPTSKTTVTANTLIVLCVPPVRNVHKRQSLFFTTEQLSSTDQLNYSYS